MKIENTNEIQIEPVNDEVFDLETLINEGTDAYIPLKFVYPNTNKTVGVFIKPVTTQEFVNATRGGNNIFINVINGNLFDKNREPIKTEIIEKLPAGVTLELYKKIAEISGIPTEQNKEVNQEMVDKLMGF